MPAASEVSLWVDALHAPLVSAMLDVMGTAIHPLAVGGPDGAADELANTLGLTPSRDFREMQVNHPAAFLLLATSAGLKPESLRAAVADGTVVLTLEPPAMDADGFAVLGAPDAAGRVIFVPRFERCPGFLDAADPYAAVGRPAQLLISSHGPAAHGSLYARAFDAWRTALGFVELPESVDATFTQAPNEHPPQRVADMTGRLSALARCPDGASVTLHLNNQSTQAARSLHAVGPDGELHVTDGRYTLHHRQSQQHDTSDSAAAAHVGYLDLIVAHWQRLLDRPPMPANPTLDRHALACIHATLLSARTGEPERPEQMLKARM